MNIKNIIYGLPLLAILMLAACGSGGASGGGGAAAITATANTAAQSLTVNTAMASFSPLAASGGATPYTYSTTGTLPAGLSLNAGTGAVTGTPTSSYAAANLVFSVKDANNVVASTNSTVSFTVVAAAPTTTVAPVVSGNPSTGLTLSVTINKNGTGYWLLLPAADPVPTVSAVQLGTAFAMTANVAANPAINPPMSTINPVASLAYRIYFVAQDVSNNVQAVVQNVAVTTNLPTLAQGGLTWMPVISLDTWTNADAYCTNTTINGVTGWRMPTQPELSALYTSGLMNGQGWILGSTWSSTPYIPIAGYYEVVYLDVGIVSWGSTSAPLYPGYVSCVR